MLCPYCLGDAKRKADKCPHCETNMPPLYAQKYSFLRPPIVLSITGFRGHGKTVYLAALLHILANHLTEKWPGFYRHGLDQDTIDTIKKNLALLEKGGLPDATRQNFPKPSIHLLANMPKFKSRQVIMYDPPGEAFEEDLRLEKYAHFVKKAKTVLFLISLVDLDDPIAADMHRLLEVYTLGMQRLKAKTANQHLVVVFTKADLLLVNHFKDHPQLVEYLQKSSEAPVRDLNLYLKELHNFSQKLADFTENHLKARNFVSMAKDNFKSISYCAISSLGRPPDSGRLSVAMQPQRVIDPMLLVLEKS